MPTPRLPFKFNVPLEADRTLPFSTHWEESAFHLKVELATVPWFKPPPPAKFQELPSHMAAVVSPTLTVEP